MFKMATEPKSLWVIPGGHHGDLYDINNEQLKNRLLKYLEPK